MLSDRIKTLPPSAPAVPATTAPTLNTEQAKLKNELDELEAAKKRGKSSEFSSINIRAQLLQTQTRNLLHKEQKGLPGSCKSALFYSQALLFFIKTEIDTATSIQIGFNISPQEHRSYLFNRFSSENKEHSKLIERCSKVTQTEPPKL